MGRKSKLTESQWIEIERRLIEGESGCSLAKEFGLSETAIRKRKSSEVEQIKSIANQMVSVEREFMRLPISSQITVSNLASKLRAISENLASAASLGAATAHRLNSLANNEVNKIDDATPLESLEAIRGVSVLTKLANDSASIALNLLAANKEAMAKMAHTDTAKRKAVDYSDDELLEILHNGS